MAYSIVLKKRFANKVQKVLTYLEKGWSHKVASEFLEKVDYRIEQVIRSPFSDAPSTKIKGVRGLLLTRHNKM